MLSVCPSYRSPKSSDVGKYDNIGIIVAGVVADCDVDQLPTFGVGVTESLVRIL